MKDREVMLTQFSKVTFQSNSKTKTIYVIQPPSLSSPYTKPQRVPNSKWDGECSIDKE